MRRSPRAAIGRLGGAAAAAALLALALTGAGTAAAQTTSTADPTVRLTTPYPALMVEPGSDVKLDLSASAPQPERVDLSVGGLPTGWKATLRGGGFVISGLTAAPDPPGKAQLELSVPVATAPGAYNLTVTEAAPQGSSLLDLTVTVAKEVDSGITLTADFPSLKGGPTDTFSYTLTLTNNTPTQQTFNFVGTGPEGWTVTASPAAESRANTVSVDGGGTSQIKVAATPPAQVAAGKYPIQVDVTGANGASGKITLGAEVSGTGTLDAATEDGRLNLSGRSNHTTKETIVVSNTGTAALSNVSLTATPPSGWQVTFSPKQLDQIAAGQKADVVAEIKPAKDAIAGDYAATVNVNAGTSSKALDLRYTVKTSRSWGLIGLVIILAAAAVLFGVVRRLGRR
jgi:uncharacterized membrane protein